MKIKAETYTCKVLRTILSNLTTGSNIPESNEMQEVFSGLERIIPEIFKDDYEFWKYESLDGIFLREAIKSNEFEVILTGMCLLITDQTLTPIYLDMKIGEEINKFEWIYCKLGEIENDNLVRIPYESSKWKKLLYEFEISTMNWAFEIEYKKARADIRN